MKLSERIAMTKDRPGPGWDARKTYAQNRIDSKIKAALPPLTPEEEARPFAKYFYETIKPCDPAHYAEMDRPMDPTRAFGPEEINRLLDVNRLETEETEIGWCNLPNGAGFIANKNFYAGATADMIDWWFAWHSLEDLRYRIWYPPQHAGIMLSPIDQARILDPDIPNREKNWGVTHCVTENCGCGMENVDISFRSPANMGFDMERFNKVIAAFAGGEGLSLPVDDGDSSIAAPAIMCHVFYNVPGGLVHRTRFWMGYGFAEDGKPVLRLPPGVSVPAAAIQGLARHNVKEFARFGDLLPRIYKEFGHSMHC